MNWTLQGVQRFRGRWLRRLGFFLGQILPFMLASVLFVILTLHIFGICKVQAESDVVRDLGLLLAASIGWFFLYKRTRSVEQTTEIAERSLTTERFNRSVEQLVSKNPFMRLVGLRSLERIANAHEEERINIMEALSARIHELAPLNHDPNLRKWQRPDVKFAIEMLARIAEPLSKDEKNRYCRLENINLSGLAFERINLSYFQLIKVDLTASEFKEVIFTDTVLSFSIINDTNFVDCKKLGKSRVMTARWSEKHPPRGLQKWNLPPENHPREDSFISQPIRTK